MSPRYQCSLCSLFGFNLEDQLGVRAQFPTKVLVHSFWKSILEGIRLKWNRKNQTSPPTYKFSWIVRTRCWTTTPGCFFGNMKRGDNSHLIWGKKFGTVGTMHFRVLPGEQHLEPQIIKIIVPFFTSFSTSWSPLKSVSLAQVVKFWKKTCRIGSKKTRKRDKEK